MVFISPAFAISHHMQDRVSAIWGWLVRLVFIVLLPMLLIGAPAQADTYENLKAGKLSGKVIVQWLEPDLFLFLPDDKSPLKFTRSTGEEIKPGRMLTDGGSIPRPMRAFRNYSAWGYAPAFIVHDWLFFIKRCKQDNYRDYTLESAASVLGEIIKTMMVSGSVEKDETTVNVMVAAVSSRFARQYWEDTGCVQPPVAFGRTPIAQFTLSFD